MQLLLGVLLAALMPATHTQQMDPADSPMLVLNAGTSSDEAAVTTQKVRQQYEAFPYPYRNPEHYNSTMHPARTSVGRTQLGVLLLLVLS